MRKLVYIALIFTVLLIGLASCKDDEPKIEKHNLELVLSKTSLEIGESIKLDVRTDKGVDFNTLSWSNSEDDVVKFDKDTLEITALEEGESTISVSGLTVNSDSITIKVNKMINKYTITYVLNGGTNAENNPTEYKEGDSFELEKATRKWYKFMGWFNEDGDQVEKIKKDTKGNLTLTAKWEEIEQNKNEYTIEYELNGGNWDYANYQDVVDDLLNDYNACLHTNYTIKTLPDGSWSAINFHNFFYERLNGVEMNKKWAWLAEYFSENGGKANAKPCGLLNTCTSANEFDKINSNYKYAVSYEFRGFIKGKQFDSNINYLSADYSLNEVRNGFWDILNKTQQTETKQLKGNVTTLPIPVKPYFLFDGWYKEADFSGEKLSSEVEFKRDTTLYAKWVEEGPVESVTIDNKIEELLYNRTLQLKWTVLPLDASNPNVDFLSSDESVITINSKGFIETVGEGVAKITIISQSNTLIKEEFTITVYKPDRINVNYETNSYVGVGGNIKVNAEYVSRTNENVTLNYKSNDESIIKVDNNGVITGLKTGYATITISGKDQEVEVGVTVLDKDTSDLMDLIIKSHNSNIYVTEDMLIALAYRANIYGSASDILYNYIYEEKELFTKLESEGGSGNRPGNKMTSVEFITVHYTAGASPTSDATATAQYFANGGGGASIHYCTGNDGVVHCMPDDEVAWHAGDGTGTKFEWISTGIKGNTLDVKVSVNDDGYFTIDGKATTVKAPGGLDRVLNQYVSPSEKYFTLLGPAVDIFNGEYHIGTTWWCNDQVAEGRICSKGGNNNSIGIESAVNKGSDLWKTWQITAKLVSKLMVENDLAINRVVGHNFFSGKNCPQPMLEKEGEIWYQFIECVESEYEIRTKYQDATITCKSNNPDILSDEGRIIKRPNYTTSVSYTVTITQNGKTNTITLASIIPGVYE